MTVVPPEGMGAENREKIAAYMQLPFYGESTSFPRNPFSQQCHMTIPVTRNSGTSRFSLPADTVKGSGPQTVPWRGLFNAEAGSHSVSFFQSPKKSYLLFYINILEVKEFLI